MFQKKIYVAIYCGHTQIDDRYSPYNIYALYVNIYKLYIYICTCIYLEMCSMNPGKSILINLIFKELMEVPISIETHTS